MPCIPFTDCLAACKKAGMSSCCSHKQQLPGGAAQQCKGMSDLQQCYCMQEHACVIAAWLCTPLHVLTYIISCEASGVPAVAQHANRQ